ncbi:MAG: thiamine pyrophosphate-dependent enzyme, partial [Sandaracinaceae bacterium]
GHEGNAAVAAALRVTDPALLHYRSGAFYLARANQSAGVDGLEDVLLGVVASRDEPISGGRHKVFGRRELAISPQTSTIASHLPRAIGLGFAIERAKKLGLPTDTPHDAIVICTFGDASINHSTAVGAINAACQAAHAHLRLPVLFVCEDNGLGISVPTPPGWVAAAYGQRAGLQYFAADGCDVVEAHRVARAAVEWVRQRRRPALLHLSVVRLLGHAGSDVELAYRSASAIRDAEARDPVRRTAACLLEAGVPADEVRAIYEERREAVAVRVRDAAEREPLRDARDVMTPLAAPTEAEVRRAFNALGSAASETRMTVAQALNHTLGALLDQLPEVLLFGEDVGRKGGVYGVTRGLQKRAGRARVFDTLLDEQTILGLALGAAQHGFLPIPEIQYLAYLHNALDQIRGEASSLRFFSQGAYQNPMVVRVASFAYQRGFGGHFHNDHAVAALRDIPGVLIASPSRADDASSMLRVCLASACVHGTVSLFLEPIALYGTRDLHEPGDDAWLAAPDDTPALPGSARTYGPDDATLLIVSFANGVPMSLRAARTLESQGVRARVLDLRWIAPLPAADLLREATAAGSVLVADETRRSGGVSEAVITALVDGGFRGPIRRVTSEDSFVPLGPAAHHVLLSEQAIVAAARSLDRDAGGDPRDPRVSSSPA